jgi:hypothetical protein
MVDCKHLGAAVARVEDLGKPILHPPIELAGAFKKNSSAFCGVSTKKAFPSLSISGMAIFLTLPGGEPSRGSSEGSGPGFQLTL